MNSIGILLVGFVGFALGQLHHVNDHCKRDCSRSHSHSHQTTKVCASNHQTYDNLCEFSVASCIEHELHGHSLRLVRHDACPTTTHAPHVDHCNDLCDEDFRHVCGSDGIVYDNMCRFRRARCEAAKMNVTLFVVAMTDICPPSRRPDCAKYQLDINDIAFEDGAAFKPRCPSDHTYLCASDGHTYTNECQLCSYMDQKKELLTIVLDKPCLH